MVEKDYSQSEVNQQEENSEKETLEKNAEGTGNIDADETVDGDSTSEVSSEEKQSEEKQVDSKEDSKEDLEEDSKEDSEEISEEQLQIQKLQQEIKEKQNRILRLQADMENYRRRVRLDQELAAKYRAQSLIENIIPALDNFERALNVEAKEEETKQLLKGMEMVYRQLVDALKSEGLTTIEAIGKEFDPNYHQAVMQVEDSNFESNVVIEELQKGYMLKDRVIRPSMVKVNQ